MTKTEYAFSFVIVICVLTIIIRGVVQYKSNESPLIREETYKVIDKVKKDKYGEYTIKCEDIDGNMLNLKLTNISQNKKIDVDQFYKVILVGKIYDFQIINYKRKIGMNNKLYIIGFGEVEEF